MSTLRPIRVLFYVQHLLGIGHLMRARRIAMALHEQQFDVTLVTGGMPLTDFTVPGVAHIELPAMGLSSTDFDTLVDDTGKPVDEIYRNKRKNTLLNTYRAVLPDIVLLEAFPFGRRQVRFELLPLIELIESSNPRPLLLSSIRDILQKRVKPGRDSETTRLINTYFDNVLVHGDPAFLPLEASFSCAADITDKLLYTGIVADAKPEVGSDQFDIVVSAGGGAVGAQLVRASIVASRVLSKDLSWCIIAGPNMPEKDYSAIVAGAVKNVTVTRFRSDFTSLLVTARLSVSQAGYNTVSDVLQAGCRCVLVPFSAGGETEQFDRAQRLDQMGRATVLLEDSLNAEKLAEAIDTALASEPGDNHTINADGAAQTGRILKNLLNRHLVSTGQID